MRSAATSVVPGVGVMAGVGVASGFGVVFGVNVGVGVGVASGFAPGSFSGRNSPASHVKSSTPDIVKITVRPEFGAASLSLSLSPLSGIVNS